MSTEEPKYIDKAKDLGNRLLNAFNSATGIPYAQINLATYDMTKLASLFHLN